MPCELDFSPNSDKHKNSFTLHTTNADTAAVVIVIKGVTNCQTIKSAGYCMLRLIKIMLFL